MSALGADSVDDRAGQLTGDPVAAARAMLGWQLVRDDATGYRSARIVEVEAYGGPEDLASHARFGATARTVVMFGPAGRAYVYRVYGMHDCLNVVTGSAGVASAVLIRAVEPLEGIETMRAARLAVSTRRRAARSADGQRHTANQLATTPDQRLASGPGRVAAAFGLDTGWTGLDLLDPAGPLRLEVGAAEAPPRAAIMAGPRIGIAYAGTEWAARPWRLWLAGSAAVSGPRTPSTADR